MLSESTVHLELHRKYCTIYGNYPSIEYHHEKQQTDASRPEFVFRCSLSYVCIIKKKLCWYSSVWPTLSCQVLMFKNLFKCLKIINTMSKLLKLSRVKWSSHILQNIDICHHKSINLVHYAQLHLGDLNAYIEWWALILLQTVIFWGDFCICSTFHFSCLSGLNRGRVPSARMQMSIKMLKHLGLGSACRARVYFTLTSAVMMSNTAAPGIFMCVGCVFVCLELTEVGWLDCWFIIF